MPWSETAPVEQRPQFIEDYQGASIPCPHRIRDVVASIYVRRERSIRTGDRRSCSIGLPPVIRTSSGRRRLPRGTCWHAAAWWSSDGAGATSAPWGGGARDHDAERSVDGRLQGAVHHARRHLVHHLHHRPLGQARRTGPHLSRVTRSTVLPMLPVYSVTHLPGCSWPRLRGQNARRYCKSAGYVAVMLL
jgi:hypothetical protein